MKIEVNKKTTIESLEFELLQVREELSKLQKMNSLMEKRLEELEKKLLNQ